MSAHAAWLRWVCQREDHPGGGATGIARAAADASGSVGSSASGNRWNKSN